MYSPRIHDAAVRHPSRREGFPLFSATGLQSVGKDRKNNLILNAVDGIIFTFFS